MADYITNPDGTRTLVPGGTSKGQTQITAEIADNGSAGEPLNTNAAAEKLGGSSKIQTQPAPTVAPGAAAQNRASALNKMLDARARQQMAALGAQREVEENARRWQPTKENIRNSGLSYTDFLRGAKNAGAQIDPLETLLQFHGQDPAVSMKEAEAAKKKAESQEKMNLIGNALMHVGNFIGAMQGGHGAVKLEEPQKLTERQRLMKEKTEAMNQNAWANTYNVYKTKIAEERAKETARLAAEREAAREKKDAEYIRLKAEEAARKAAKDEKDAARNDEKLKHTIEKDKKQLEINQQNANSRAVSANAAATNAAKKENKNGGSGGGSKDYEQTVTETNSLTGEKKTKTTSRHYGSQGSRGGKSQSAVAKLGIHK